MLRLERDANRACDGPDGELEEVFRLNLMRRTVAVGLAACLCALAFTVGLAIRATLPGLGMDASVAQTPEMPAAQGTPAPAEAALAQAQPNAPTVGEPQRPPMADPAVAQRVTIDGAVRGRVVIQDRVVIETRGAAYDLGPYERASVAAARLNLALEQNAKPAEIQAIQREGAWTVVAGDRVIIGVATGDLPDAETTGQQLATSWATNIALAVHELQGTKPGEDQPLPEFRAEGRDLREDGASIGVLMINGQEVLRIYASSPGLTPPQRAQVVAERLVEAVKNGAMPADVGTTTVQGMSIVKIGETLLVTVSPIDAERANVTEDELARVWSKSIAGALSEHFAQASGPLKKPADEWVPREPYDDKWVPIISILEGVRVGLARVNGPRSRVQLVQAVAQLETHWKRNLEIDVFIPISTKVPGETIDWVKGCAVTGLADIRL